MKQLTYLKSKALSWWDVPEPSLQASGEALVRPFVAARCDGDALFLRHDVDRLLRVGAALHVIDSAFAKPADGVFHGPFAYGHECVAEVVAVGADVRNHALNDVVIVPWAVSCGACARCDSGLTSHCERSSTPVAAYGFGKAIGEYGGMVSDLVRVPYADAMLVRVPDGLDPLAVASASDNMPDAYRAVAPQLQKHPGAPVLIVGGGAKSIGLYAAGMAVALGSSRVDYIDTDAARLRIAEQLGAHAIVLKKGARWFDQGQPPVPGGYLISVEASSLSKGLGYALSALAPGGMCTALGFYLRKRTPLPLWNMYLKSATLHVGVAHARMHVPAVLELIARGAFDPSLLAPLVGDWNDADRILLERATKVIVRRKPLRERALAQAAALPA
jgi:threonine dehydrogenase-like Zn-dependent dehydrogenase